MASWEKLVRYIARCKPCNTAMSTEASAEVQHVLYRFRLEAAGAPLGTSAAVEVGNLIPMMSGTSLGILCFSCGKARAAHGVRGRLNRDIKCTAKCQAATGTDCECSCAGKNHGAKFSVDGDAVRGKLR